jgi:hypothetical protein
MRHAYCPGLEIHIGPIAVHDLLFSHASHQKELVPEFLVGIADCENRVEFFLFVNLRFFFGVTRPVLFSHETANALSLQERHDVLEFVVDRAGCLLFLVSQKCRELEQVSPVNVGDMGLTAGFQEIFERCPIRRVASGLVSELHVSKVVRDRHGERLVAVPVSAIEHNINDVCSARSVRLLSAVSSHSRQQHFYPLKAGLASCLRAIRDDKRLQSAVLPCHLRGRHLVLFDRSLREQQGNSGGLAAFELIW